jgi:hypothetical protein
VRERRHAFPRIGQIVLLTGVCPYRISR